MRAREEILEFWNRGGHTTCKFVASNSGEKDAVAVRGEVRPKLPSGFGWRNASTGCRDESRIVNCRQVEILRSDVDVTTSASAFFFDFRKIGALIPVRFRVVVIRYRVEQGRLRVSPREECVGHAYDRGGIHSAAQFRKDRSRRTEAASHG